MVQMWCEVLMEEIKLQDNSEEITKNNNKRNIIIGAMTFIVLCVIIFVVAISASKSGSSTAHDYLTYSNYVRIQDGMSYSQVVHILGDNDGMLDTSSSYGGYTLSYYTWSNNLGTKCIVVGFENGKVCAKSQIGLR